MATLSDPKVSATGLTTSWGRITTDTQSGTFWCYTSTNSSETAAAIKANGLEADFDEDVDSGTQRVRWYSNRPHFYLTGHTAGQSYYQHFVQNDGSDSNVVSSGPFQTARDAPALGPVRFTRVCTPTYPEISGAADGITKWAKSPDGNYLYSSGIEAGAFVWDRTDPDNVLYHANLPFLEPDGVTVSADDVRDVHVIGDTLFLIGRQVNFTLSNAPGMICAYDITDPADPEWVSTLLAADDQILRPSGNYGNNWLQSAVSIGDNLLIASQYSGLNIYDVSDPSAMALRSKFNLVDLIRALSAGSVQNIESASVISTSVFEVTITGHGYSNGDTVFTNGLPLDADRQYATVSNATTNTFELDVNATGYTSGGDVQIAPDPAVLFECSGIAKKVSDDWVVMSNHGDGAVAIDVSDLDNPGDPQIYRTNTTELVSTGAAGNGIRLRIRQVQIDERGYLYGVPNANDSSTSRPERGPIVLDISDPTAVTGDDFIYTHIGVENNDLWGDNGIGEDGWGDQIIQGINLWNDYLFVPNGQRGTIVYDKTDPENMVCLGLLGTDLDPGDNLYQTFVDRAPNGKVYAYYSGGYEPVPNRKLYVDRLTGGRGMADLYIGMLPGDMEMDNYTQTLTSAVARGSRASGGDFAVPEGYQLVEYVMHANVTAERVFQFGLYPATADDDGEPVASSAPVGTHIETVAVTGSATLITATLPAPVTGISGNYTPMVVLHSSSGAGSNTLSANAAGSHPKSANLGVDSGELPAEWPTSAAGSKAFFIAAGFDLIPATGLSTSNAGALTRTSTGTHNDAVKKFTYIEG